MSRFLDAGYDTEANRDYSGMSKGGTDFGIGVIIPSQYGHRSVDGDDSDPDLYSDNAGMDYPGGNPNTPLGKMAEFAADATAAPTPPPVVPKHHGHPVVKAVGAGALAGGIATCLQVGALAATGIGAAAAGLMYLITKR